MTFGPDLNWLADDEGNLRPHVARALADEPLAMPADASRFQAFPRPARPLPSGRQASITEVLVLAVFRAVGWAFERLTRVPRQAWVRIGAIAAIFALGAAAGGATRVRPAPQVQVIERPQLVYRDREVRVPSAWIGGEGANLRTGPGSEYEAAGRAGAGEAVGVRGHESGWCHLVTNSGLSGWAFGLDLHDPSAPWRVGVTTRALWFESEPDYFELPEGARVLVEEVVDETGARVVLPDGTRLWVPVEALTLV